MHFVVLQPPKRFVRRQNNFPAIVPVAMEVLLLVLVYTTFVASSVLRRNGGKIVVRYHFLLLVVPGVLSGTLFAGERHFAAVNEAVIVVGVSVIAFL